MKASLAALMALAIICCSAPAFAGHELFTELVNDTNSDFVTVKQNFRAAYTAGYGSWKDYGEATGFSIDDMEQRINTRRAILEALTSTADKTADVRTRGVVKMLIHDLDYINLSLLALIRDDRGYSGYIRTTDGELVGGVSKWQEGIRQALLEVRRSVRMYNRISSQADPAGLIVPAVN